MITQICLAAGVLELPWINEMIEDQRIFDIGLIRDVANPLDRLIRHITDTMARLFAQDDQTDIPTIAVAIEVESQTEGIPTDATDTFSAPPPIHSLLPRP